MLCRAVLSQGGQEVNLEDEEQEEGDLYSMYRCAWVCLLIRWFVQLVDVAVETRAKP